MSRGLLLTLTEPPPAMEEEFNAWYDSEHIPERLAIPGFRSARRWVRGGTYLATYELDSPQVLSSSEYLARYQNQTPWSRRCLGKCLTFKRWACTQVEPGDADPHGAAVAMAFTHKPERFSAVLQSRRFAAESGEAIFLYELSDPRQQSEDVYRLYRS
ncbi:MAG TPA: hypothetical protein VHI32_10385 [Burkholderiales bacterium]|nr:hypothetical protein [Burkholderiales bacterium]